MDARAEIACVRVRDGQFKSELIVSRMVPNDALKQLQRTPRLTAVRGELRHADGGLDVVGMLRKTAEYTVMACRDCPARSNCRACLRRRSRSGEAGCVDMVT